MHEQATMKSLGIARSKLVIDGQPVPRLGDNECVGMPYCDNVHSLSKSRDRCQQGCNDICDHLQQMGFELHEEAGASTYMETLGGVIDGEAGQIRSTKKRMWRVILAFEHMCSAKVSTQLVQKLLGHGITLCILNRAGMCIFRRLYDFVERGGKSRYLSFAEREECRIFIGLVPMLFADIRRPWADTITATDASPEGFGICERKSTPEEVSSIGEWE